MSKIGESSHQGRRGPGESTTDAAPLAVGDDYLRKRHLSEGPKRRRINRRTTDLDLWDLRDTELDQRNARIWETVLPDCLRAAGVDMTCGHSTKERGPRGEKICRAYAAAHRICNSRYGIPVSRLAEIAGNGRSKVSRWLSADRPDVEGLILAWAIAGGAQRAERTDTTTLDVTIEAARVLARAARESGDSPLALASAALLAAFGA